MTKLKINTNESKTMNEDINETLGTLRDRVTEAVETLVDWTDEQEHVNPEFEAIYHEFDRIRDLVNKVNTKQER